MHCTLLFATALATLPPRVENRRSPSLDARVHSEDRNRHYSANSIFAVISACDTHPCTLAAVRWSRGSMGGYQIYGYMTTVPIPSSYRRHFTYANGTSVRNESPCIASTTVWTCAIVERLSYNLLENALSDTPIPLRMRLVSLKEMGAGVMCGGCRYMRSQGTIPSIDR
ncbi:hypothetical protein EDD16DRAFT_1181584 [Pisolithus croceorrhizus]|nr:hypothetical protein EDD16DRAFT_1181584 [Pisolithus croceorrhizus]